MKDLLRNHPEMKAQLWKNGQMMKSGLRQLGFNLEDTPTRSPRGS